MASIRWIPLAALALAPLLMAPTPAPAQIAYLEITIPIANGLNPALRPPVATYEWATAPGNSDPAEVRYAFVSIEGFSGSYTLTEDYLLNTPAAPEWSYWGPYAPPAVGTSLTTAPMDFGGYVFAVQGRGGSGTPEDLDTTRNTRRVLVSQRSTGPLLTVTGDHIETIYTSSPTTPPVVIDVNGGVAIQFCWSADASAYGGIVTGYRFGWDVIDPDDDSQWEIAFTPFVSEQACSPERTFYFGTHMFSVQVRDNDDYRTLAQIRVNTRPVVPVEKTTWGAVKALYRD